MTWLFTLLAMAVIALVAGVVTGRIAGSMEPPASSLPFRGLPPDDVRSGDLEQVRFDAALRGYRMDQVDVVLDRLAVELSRRDERIAGLQAELAAVLLELNERTTRAEGRAGGAVVDGDPGTPPSPYDAAFSPPSGQFQLPISGGFDLPAWQDRSPD